MTRTAGEQGQATVELALCLPLVALLLAALVEVGLVVGDQARLWHAAREAARSAVVDPDEDAALYAAQRSGLRPIDMTINPDRHRRVAGEPLTVSLTYTPEARVPLWRGFLEGLELEAAATMRIERP